jgi:hypothetical protein
MMAKEKGQARSPPLKKTMPDMLLAVGFEKNKLHENSWDRWGWFDTGQSALCSFIYFV